MRIELRMMWQEEYVGLYSAVAFPVEHDDAALVMQVGSGAGVASGGAGFAAPPPPW